MIKKILFLSLCLSACLICSGQTGGQTPEPPFYAEDYNYVTNDGAWCWFSDPRAIYVDNKVFGGFVDKEGSIWAFTYDPATGEKYQHKLYDKLQYDDHSNPSVMALPDKRIAIFFSAHGPSPIYYTVTRKAADITEWEDLRQISPGVDGEKGYCYTNPVMLSSEKNQIYLFFRGPNFKPCYITTKDLKTWSDPVTVVDKKPGPQAGGRPYAKIASNGKDKIFMAFTDGHPRNEPTNSIYCVMYKKGKFRKVGGDVITGSDSSIYPDQADLVYDARTTYDKAWIWDIAIDKNDNPVLVYARFSDQNNIHSYWYAFWNGKSWENHKIADAGQWFMRNNYNDKNVFEHENNYSGGVYLDHNDPSIVYTSRPFKNVYEIEKWTFTGGEKKWEVEPVTSGSLRDNVRPFVIRDYPQGQPNLLWMYVYNYKFYQNYNTAIKINQVYKGFDKSMTKEAVTEVASKVFAWQTADFVEHPLQSLSARGWRAGVLFRGMFDWADYIDTPEMFAPLRKIFDKELWHPHNNMTHADGLCIGQTYLDMYNKFKEKKMIVPIKARFDWLLTYELDPNIDNTKGFSERWWWCDALYMAPSVFSRLWRITGDEKYMEHAHREYLACYDQLYDKDEDLFFRDSHYLDKREANGEKVFWGRGNGWVLAGLMEMLKTLPEDDTKYRPYYVNLFLEMSERIAGLQRENGFWSSSLLDPVTYSQPETSSTGMFVAALAYGINEGILPREKYYDVVKKGWEALVSCVSVDGRLGWCQPVGASPKLIKRSDNELYGTGAFLMSARQMVRLAEK